MDIRRVDILTGKFCVQSRLLILTLFISQFIHLAGSVEMELRGFIIIDRCEFHFTREH